MKITFGEAVAAMLSTIATGVIAYAVVGQQNAIALGALITIVAAANSFFLRAKVVSPTDPSAPVNPAAPSKPMPPTPPFTLVDGHELPGFVKPPPPPIP